jgi:hypothetical protein
MSDLIRRQSEMAVRVDNFRSENPDVFKNSPKAVAAFGLVQNGVPRLQGLGALRVSAAESKFEYTDRRKSYRESLYAKLSGIARTARQIARENPEFINSFKIPRDNRNDTTLLDTARSFAENLTAVKQLFLDFAEEEDFIDDLLAEIADFEQSIGDRTPRTGSASARARRSTIF